MDSDLDSEFSLTSVGNTKIINNKNAEGKITADNQSSLHHIELVKSQSDKHSPSTSVKKIEPDFNIFKDFN